MALIWIAALAALASTDVAPPQPGDVIKRPHWERTPTGAEIADAYPLGAAGEGWGGVVRIQCTVRADGSLTNCATTECPTGHGFGGATLSLTSKFRLARNDLDGQPVEGRKVSFPIQWMMNGPDSIPAKCRKPVTPPADTTPPQPAAAPPAPRPGA